MITGAILPSILAVPFGRRWGKTAIGELGQIVTVDRQRRGLGVAQLTAAATAPPRIR
jgi:hypothetical protein